MLKKISIFSALLIGIIAILAVGGVFWYRQALGAVSADSAKVRFIVTKGASATQIAKQLEDQHLIKSALAFKIYTQIHSLSGKIFAGEFNLTKNMSLSQVVAKLRQGPEEIWVTIPEGLRHEEYPQKFIDALGLTGAAATDFSNQFISLTKNQEGYLFPDTYLFPKDVTAQMVINTLTSTFDKKTVELKPTVQQLILASIVQREAITPEDMKGVAAVFMNRHQAGMSLGSDVTVEYALGYDKLEETWWKENLTADDLAINSPYNTRRFAGFPPGPISNPGLVALEAAVNPNSNDYYYFLADSDGKIHFAKTLEEHNALVARYLR